MKKRVAKGIKKHKISYEMKLVKRKSKVRWLVIERPTGSIITESEFEDEAQKVCDHQNKYKQWENQGGVVKHLTLGKYNERTKQKIL